MDAPYPAALDDCYDTLLWIKRHAKGHGIREDQLMVGEHCIRTFKYAVDHYFAEQTAKR
ncbi:hypothetical protein B2I21_03275 [Chryseobacterium mucoviscidosis]|nr:hypothetical protein B2I21_03275 [Chryseobacterium mucoviscidosis]